MLKCLLKWLHRPTRPGRFLVGQVCLETYGCLEDIGIWRCWKYASASASTTSSLTCPMTDWILAAHSTWKSHSTFTPFTSIMRSPSFRPSHEQNMAQTSARRRHRKLATILALTECTGSSFTCISKSVVMLVSSSCIVHKFAKPQTRDRPKSNRHE